MGANKKPIGWHPPTQEQLQAVSNALAAQNGLNTVPGQEHALDIYLHKSVILREFFLLRLRFMIALMNRLWRRGQLKRARMLDLGGGSGIVSSMLSPYVGHIDLLDLDCAAAALLFGLVPAGNVMLHEKDALTWQPESAPDIIVAADVLEHFRELPPILSRIHQWMGADSVLFTSLPTENIWYLVLRKIFNKTKPWDHYHTSDEVEAALRAHGFKRVARLCHPLGLPLFALFSISAWKKA